MQKIVTNLWFDNEAEDAAEFYTSVFKNSKICNVTYYTKSAEAIAGKPAGSVMTVDFELDGQAYTALNGGPEFKFNEAVSLLINCADQDEVDYYWEKLGAGGKLGPCGWLKDKFGVSWQVAPTILNEMINDPDREKVERVTACFMKMGKLDIAEIRRAYSGE
jgi:predicted 3-demethylubiquinone-9 3-methyltransferase (glyoxalase superfamily)